jgi:hypothetical protein
MRLRPAKAAGVYDCTSLTSRIQSLFRERRNLGRRKSDGSRGEKTPEPVAGRIGADSEREGWATISTHDGRHLERRGNTRSWQARWLSDEDPE